MRATDFAYWLQGYFELAGTGPLTAEQAACIQKHLSLVFVHEIDPSYREREKLDEIHAGKDIAKELEALKKPNPPVGPGIYPDIKGRPPVMRC